MLTPGAYDPRFMKPATLCRCGHILECCADCMGWLRQNSQRIAMSIESWWRCVHEYSDILSPSFRARMATADEVEAYYVAYHESQR